MDKGQTRTEANRQIRKLIKASSWRTRLRIWAGCRAGRRLRAKLEELERRAGQ